MTDLLMRIEAALLRGEAAADRLARRHRTLRAAANDTLADLDRLLATGTPVQAEAQVERRRADG